MKKKTVYAIAQLMQVIAPDDGDGLEYNDPEPVICNGLGAWEDCEKAQSRCDKLNKKNCKEEGDVESFQVVALVVN